jgi:AsmA family protein
MTGVFPWRRALKWLLWLMVVLVGMILLLAAALDAGYLHGPLVRFFAAHAQREIRVDGPLRLQVLSRRPTLVAERVTIGSPPWTPPGVAVQAGKITVVFETPHLGRPLELASLELEAVTLHLNRDASGHANWAMKNPDKSPPQGLPIIHALSMLDAHVLLDDAQKHRQFDGTVSAQDGKAADGTQPLRIEAKGQLNGRPVIIEVLGEPLRSARRDQHYGFTFNERSSGSRLTGKGVLLKPFDVHYFDATFEGSGADLKDLYYLTGTKLIDTGSYHLTGKIARRVYTSSLSDLAVTFGQSDIHGSISIEMQRGLTRIEGDLTSRSLNSADLGARAAGRDSGAASARPTLLSDEAPDPTALRHTDAAVAFHAQRADMGRVTFNDVAVKMSVERGLLAVKSLTADVLSGKLEAKLKIDARKEIPTVDLEVGIAGLQVGQYARKGTGPPAIEGPLSLQVNLTGRGKSVHEVAAGITGTVRATLPSGTVRDSLAELTGIDLRGLGLLLTKNKKEVPVRCGVASFQARDGTLTAQNLVLDTEPVLIAGEGFVHLDSETFDMVLRGYPKSTRFFQLRSPILIRGTLAHPSVGIQGQDSKLVLIDRGKAKDTDCESLLQ